MAYTLLSGLYDHLTKEQEFNVVLLGLENAGKTTFLEGLKTKHSTRKGLKPDQIVPTIGLNIGKLPNIQGHRLFVCDIGGQLRSLWEAYYSDCHGVIFFVDTSDPAAIQKSLESFAGVIKHPELEMVPVLLLANKQDIKDSQPLSTLLEKMKPLDVDLGDRDCRIQPLSALEGSGVEEGLAWLVQHMAYNQHRRPKRPAE